MGEFLSQTFYYIGHFLSLMLPYVCVALPVWIVIRFLYIKRKKLPVSPGREMAYLVFVLYMTALASQTLLPYRGGSFGFLLGEVSLVPFASVADAVRAAYRGSYSLLSVNILGNIAVFVPMGFFFAWLFHKDLKTVTLMTLCTSLFIEISQLFTARNTDVDDLILNTAGGLIGGLLYRFVLLIKEKIKSHGNK